MKLWRKVKFHTFGRKLASMIYGVNRNRGEGIASEKKNLFKGCKFWRNQRNLLVLRVYIRVGILTLCQKLLMLRFYANHDQGLQSQGSDQIKTNDSRVLSSKKFKT